MGKRKKKDQPKREQPALQPAEKPQPAKPAPEQAPLPDNPDDDFQ